MTQQRQKTQFVDFFDKKCFQPSQRFFSVLRQCVGFKHFHQSTRIIAKDFVKNKPGLLKKHIIKTNYYNPAVTKDDMFSNENGMFNLQNGFVTHSNNVFFGGATNSTHVSTDATAIHPAFRTAVYTLQLVSYGSPNMTHFNNARDYLTNELKKEPNSDEFGCDINHGSASEPDYEFCHWGSNLEKLKQIKQEIDPTNTFNCYQCIGWINPSE